MGRIGHHLFASSALALALTPIAARAQIAPEDLGQASDPTDVQLPTSSAELPEENGREVYLPRDFARFAPRNALDMIEQIPGFSVDDADDDARGLGQASGNLLINGDRISSKSTSVADRLSRIPTDSVLRIEVVDGASLDIPGLTGRVANIIAKTGTLSGQFSWRGQLTTDDGALGWRSGEVSLAGSSGPVDFVLALENRATRFITRGPNVFTFASGLVDPRISATSQGFDRPEVTGTFEIALAPDVQLNINTQGFWSDFDSTEDEFRPVTSTLPPFDERIASKSNDWGYELGADIAFPLGAGRLKLIVLEAYEFDDFITQLRLIEGDAVDTGTRFERFSDNGERIGRAEYSWPLWGADWQFSAEAAFNRLDQRSRLFVFDADTNSFAERAFPSGQGGVREDRYEGLLSYGRRLSDALSLQVVAGGEYSRIAQTGGAALSRSFQRPKGSIGLAWAVNDGLDINLELARRVGQLDFGDFLANVDFVDDNQNAGNNRLRPQQSWELEVEIAKDLGAWGQATLGLFHREISDYVTIIPLASGGESAGNVDSARQTGVTLDATIAFAPLGLRGAQLDIDLDVQKSRLTDPVTGAGRRFDGEDAWRLRAEYRHDIPASDWAYGAYISWFDPRARFRTRELSITETPNPRPSLFIEHKDVFGMTVNFAFENILDKGLELRRTVFDGPRDVSPVLFTEDRSRFFGYSLLLQVTGSF